jgi:hypothetical protein
MSFTDPELFEVGWSALGQPRRAVLTEVVADGIAAGQLRQDLDTGLFVDVLSAVPIWSQLVQPGGGFSIESAYATVDLLLTGAAPPDGTRRRLRGHHRRDQAAVRDRRCAGVLRGARA